MRWLATLVLAGTVAGCGSDWQPIETPAPRATETQPTQTFVTTDGARFVPGEPAKPLPAVELEWRAVESTGGRLILSGLTMHRMPVNRGCIDYRSVSIGPPDGRFRRVTVTGQVRNGRVGPCSNRRDRIVIEGANWTRDLIAVPREVFMPDARLTWHQKASATHGILQPDRRTILVHYSYGGCQDLARVDATLRGTVVTVDLRTGVDPELPEDVGCSGFEAFGYAVARLPENAPPETTIQVVRCGGPREPRCR